MGKPTIVRTGKYSGLSLKGSYKITLLDSEGNTVHELVQDNIIHKIPKGFETFLYNAAIGGVMSQGGRGTGSFTLRNTHGAETLMLGKYKGPERYDNILYKGDILAYANKSGSSITTNTDILGTVYPDLSDTIEHEGSREIILGYQFDTDCAIGTFDSIWLNPWLGFRVSAGAPLAEQLSTNYASGKYLNRGSIFQFVLYRMREIWNISSNYPNGVSSTSSSTGSQWDFYRDIQPIKRGIIISVRQTQSSAEPTHGWDLWTHDFHTRLKSIPWPSWMPETTYNEQRDNIIVFTNIIKDDLDEVFIYDHRNQLVYKTDETFESIIDTYDLSSLITALPANFAYHNGYIYFVNRVGSGTLLLVKYDTLTKEAIAIKDLRSDPILIELSEQGITNQQVITEFQRIAIVNNKLWLWRDRYGHTFDANNSLTRTSNIIRATERPNRSPIRQFNLRTLAFERVIDAYSLDRASNSRTQSAEGRDWKHGIHLLNYNRYTGLFYFQHSKTFAVSFDSDLTNALIRPEVWVCLPRIPLSHTKLPYPITKDDTQSLRITYKYEINHANNGEIVEFDQLQQDIVSSRITDIVPKAEGIEITLSRANNNETISYIDLLPEESFVLNPDEGAEKTVLIPNVFFTHDVEIKVLTESADPEDDRESDWTLRGKFNFEVSPEENSSGYYLFRYGGHTYPIIMRNENKIALRDISLFNKTDHINEGNFSDSSAYGEYLLGGNITLLMHCQSFIEEMSITLDEEKDYCFLLKETNLNTFKVWNLIPEELPLAEALFKRNTTAITALSSNTTIELLDNSSGDIDTWGPKRIFVNQEATSEARASNRTFTMASLPLDLSGKSQMQVRLGCRAYYTSSYIEFQINGVNVARRNSGSQTLQTSTYTIDVSGYEGIHEIRVVCYYRGSLASTISRRYYEGRFNGLRLDGEPI